MERNLLQPAFSRALRASGPFRPRPVRDFGPGIEKAGEETDPP